MARFGPVQNFQLIYMGKKSIRTAVKICILILTKINQSDRNNKMNYSSASQCDIVI